MNHFRFGDAENLLSVDDAGTIQHKFYDPAAKKWGGGPIVESVGLCKPNTDVDVDDPYLGNVHAFAQHKSGTQVVHVTFVRPDGHAVVQVH